jgi:hypothetical protein
MEPVVVFDIHIVLLGRCCKKREMGNNAKGKVEVDYQRVSRDIFFAFRHESSL